MVNSEPFLCALKFDLERYSRLRSQLAGHDLLKSGYSLREEISQGDIENLHLIKPTPQPNLYII